MRQPHLEADLRRPGAVCRGIGLAVPRTRNRLVRNIKAVRPPALSISFRSCVYERQRSPKAGMSMPWPPVRTPHGWQHRREGRTESGDRVAGSIDPEALAVSFGEEKGTTDPVSPGRWCEIVISSDS